MSPNDFDSFCEANQAALTYLCSHFADYEPLHGFDAAHLKTWLRQFQSQHRSAAIKLAKAIAYYNLSHINSLMVALKQAIDDQMQTDGINPSSVFYVPLGRAGESGLEIVRRFRNVNKLYSRQNQIVETYELPERLFRTNNPMVVIMDDFIGTGKKATDAWETTICQTIPDYIPVYLAVVVAFKEGIQKIERETRLRVLCVHALGSRHQLMETSFRGLNQREKTAIKTYCEQAGNHPLGFGNCGLLISFPYGTPNNTISVIRGSEGQNPWKGLLPSWEDLQDNS